MGMEDMYLVKTGGTAGLGTASQLVGGTGVSIAIADLNLTSLAPVRVLRLRPRAVWTGEISVKEPPHLERKKRPSRAQPRTGRSHQKRS
jgi:hypothetical protein